MLSAQGKEARVENYRHSIREDGTAKQAGRLNALPHTPEGELKALAYSCPTNRHQQWLCLCAGIKIIGGFTPHLCSFEQDCPLLSDIPLIKFTILKRVTAVLFIHLPKKKKKVSSIFLLALLKA